MDRAQKEQLVDDLGQIFESSGVVVVSHYEGLTVAEMQDLRAQMREAGGAVRVAKNKLAKIALEGKPCASIAEYLTGMTVLAYSEDPVAAAKVVEEFAKENEKLKSLAVLWVRTLWTSPVLKPCTDAIPRGAYCFYRGLHRGTCFQHRRGHWRACKQHREHLSTIEDKRPKHLKTGVWSNCDVGTHLYRTERVKWLI